MIFISESGLLDLSRKSEWDEWYVEHLRIMQTVDGIDSARRLETDSPGVPPSLAIYTARSPEVFSDPYYLSIRGFGSWQPLINPEQYRRNLYSGLDAAPTILSNQRLLVADRNAPDESLGSEFTWLECVGLDHTSAFRGLAVVDAVDAVERAGVAVYTPKG